MEGKNNVLLKPLGKVIEDAAITNLLCKMPLVIQPWTSKGLLRIRARKNNLYKRVHANPQDETGRQKYVSYRSFLRAVVRKLKTKIVFRNKFQEHEEKSGKLWQTISVAISKKQKPSTTTSLRQEDRIVHSKLRILPTNAS